MAQLLVKMVIKKSCLIGIKDHNKILACSSRNLPNVLLKQVEQFNAYEVLRYKNLLLTREALDVIITERQNRPARRVAEEATKEAKA
jgi:ribosomal protein L4